MFIYSNSMLIDDKQKSLSILPVAVLMIFFTSIGYGTGLIMNYIDNAKEVEQLEKVMLNMEARHTKLIDKLEKEVGILQKIDKRNNQPSKVNSTHIPLSKQTLVFVPPYCRDIFHHKYHCQDFLQMTN